MEYRKEIDGLRAVAVVPVILFHAGAGAFSGGYVGVDVFFVISGYLITSLILAEQDAGKFSIAQFYERRARRIMPALFVVILTCLPFAFRWMLPYQLTDFSESVAAVATFSSNILFWREVGYFGPLNEAKPLLHTWSLSVEEQYYVVFPLTLVLLRGIGRRWLGALLGVVAFASLALADWGSRRYVGATFYLAPSRVWEILLGALAAFHMHGNERTTAGRWVPRWLGEVLGLAGLVLIGCAVAGFNDTTPNPSRYTLVPTVGAVLIVLYARAGTLAGRLLSQRWLVGLGLISYSAYLWHQPLFAFARIRGTGVPGPGLLGALAALSLLLAYLTWRFVERPFRDRSRFRRKVIFAGALAGSACLVAIGFIGRLDHGFESRVPAADRYLAGFNPGIQGRYVAARFDALRLAPFASDRRKILIVGDSFAQDFVNSYAENGYLAEASVSTYYIASQCGALLTHADLLAQIDPRYRDQCGREPRFAHPEVQRRLREADLVLLVSSWQTWQAPYVAETVANLRALGVRRVVVIGRKNFGPVTPLRYLGMSDTARAAERNATTPEHLATNDYMRQHLPADTFVDFQALVCGDANTSPVFTAEGRLISFDGDHLTADGARFAGQRLFRHPLLAPWK